MGKEMLSARGLDAAVKTATEEADTKKTRVKVRDGDNLMLVVRPGGGASWVLQYRLAGKRKPLTLGAWPAVSLKLARELAGAARQQVARGIDPLETKAATRSAVSSSPATVRQLYLDWMAKQRISDVYRGNIEAAFMKDVLPEIGAMHPAKVARRDIIQILRNLEERGALEMLRRVRMWLKQMYEFALDDERVDASPVPSGQLKTFMQPDQGNFPAITDAAEVGALMTSIRGYDRPVVRAGLLLSAYLWQRPTELREATWEEFDLETARWVIPEARMKMDREHWVPLPTQAVDLLRRHQGVVGGVGWLFPGRRIDKPLSEATLGKALETLGYKGRHSPHGFRAMARTILEEHLTVDPKFLERHLAHVEPNKVTRAYNRAQFWPERITMLQRWADWLDAQH